MEEKRTEPSTQTRNHIELHEPQYGIRTDSVPTCHHLIQPAEKSRTGLDQATPSDRKHGTDFLCPGVKIFGQVQNLVFAHTDIGADSREPCDSSFQVCHPDNIVINHSVGNIFRRSDRQAVSPVYAPVFSVFLDNRFKLLKILDRKSVV